MEGGEPGRPGDGRSELEMSPDEMLAMARQVSEIVVKRLEDLDGQPAWRGGSRAELEPILRESAPENGSRADMVVERAVREVLPLAGRVDHPRFFAFVPSSPTWPGVMADYLCAGFNIFQGTWLGAGGPSQLELVVTDWFREWIGYPAETGGGLFTSGGSAASLDALVAAREAAGAPARPTVYLSDQAHTALVRAARIVGVPADGIRVIGTDDRFRMDAGELVRTIAADRAAGHTPVAICANGGATNTGAVDPLRELADVADSESVWLHVDAAYGGFAMLSDKGAEALDGLERSDSVALDAHKWLFQPFEAGCLMVRDIRRLEAAFSVRPEYLQDTELGMEHVNFADRGLQLTRSFRALKVWMSIQTFGLAAFRRAVARGIDLAEQAGRYIEASPVLEVLSPPTLSIVCFRFQPGDGRDAAALEELNDRVQAAVIASGRAMMSSTRLRGSYALRLCIMNHHTTWSDVEETLALIERVGREKM